MATRAEIEAALAMRERSALHAVDSGERSDVATMRFLLSALQERDELLLEAAPYVDSATGDGEEAGQLALRIRALLERGGA